MKTVLERYLEFVKDGKAGTPVNAMAMLFMGSKPRWFTDHPQDAGQFERCVLLLEEFPEWRARLEELSGLNEYWAALVEHWSELENLDTARGPEFSVRLREIFQPIEDRDLDSVWSDSDASMRYLT